MWDEIARQFGLHPGKTKVARMMMKFGLKVEGGRIYCGSIRIGDIALGRAAGVDRRVVKATAESISSNPELMKIFGNLHPMAKLTEVAPKMGWGTIEITPEDADKPGILADVSRIIADAGISIRQAIVEDPQLTDNPKLFVVTSAEVPAELIPRLKNAHGVREITLR